MIKLNINHTSINASNLETLVEGNIKSIFVKFIFSSEWEHLARVAVFTNGETKVSISLTSDTCAIPWEVLTAPGEVVISLRGLGNSGEYVICTENKSLGKVEESNANENVPDAGEATPDVIEALLADFAEIMGAGGVAGEDGKSAYEIAVEYGYTGTEVQWLASLKGADGENGVNGVDGTDGTDGSDGKSAYEIAVEHGYTGTEVQWLASLKGADGENGTNGVDGTDGTDGTDGKSAYEIAVEHGYSGTEVQWLASLKGADGSSFNWRGTYDATANYGLNDIIEYDGNCFIYTCLQSSFGLSPDTDSNWKLIVQKGADGRNGVDGANGTNGNDGYTPVRGTDYWTVADIAEIKSYVDDAILGGEW